MSDTLIIIPAYNEEPATLQAVVNSLLPLGYSVLVVDDGSENNRQPSFQEGFVTVVRHQLNLGQGAALQTGFAYALRKGFAYAVTFDADGQHQPTDVQKLLQPLKDGKADVALGSRFLSGASHNATLARRVVFGAARLTNRWLFGLSYSDTHNGLRAFTAAALQQMHITENRMAHATELLYQISQRRLRCTEVPVQVLYTPYSVQKGQRMRHGVRLFLDLLLHKLFR